MRWLMLLVLGASLLLVAGFADSAEKAKKELARFDGTWKATSIEHDGKHVPKEEVEKVSLEVKGEHYTFHAGKHTVKGTHKLNASKTPHEIDALRSEGPHAGEPLKGIYELTGDTYKVCFGAPGKDRPTAFSTKEGDGHRLIVMHRAK